MTIYNCHTHIFSSKHVPDKYLPFRLVRWLAKRNHFRWLAFVLNNINPFSNNDLLDRRVMLLKIALDKTQKEILDNLIDFYPPDTKFVILTMDMEYMKAGKPEKSYLKQLKHIINLPAEYKKRIYPFVFADPRKPRILNFVKKYIGKEFKGIKIYPALGYWPFDQHLMPVFEYASKNSIPVMTHCNPYGVHFREKKKNLPKVHPLTGEELKWKCRKKRRDYFGDPDNYRYVLDRYPDLKICFAHFGGTDEMDDFLNAQNRTEMNATWFYKVKGLLRDYRNTYADISFTKIDMSLVPLINATLQSSVYRKRILYGTDFYMNKIEGNEKRFSICLRDALGKRNFRQIAMINPVNYLY